MKRLDPDTLRDVLDGVDRYRLRMEALGTSRRAAQRGVIAACKDIADTLRKSIAEAESAPPRLSDWARACEGTAMGEPSDVYVRMYAGNEREAIIQNEDDGAGLTVVGGGCSSYEWHATPAELHAALEQLAQEAS